MSFSFSLLQFLKVQPAWEERASVSLSAVRPSLMRLFHISAAALLLVAASSHAQFGAPPPGGTQVHDASTLKPPAGVRVAILEFEDMECPVCGRYNPLLKVAAAKYRIPWIRHDFPLPQHAWSFTAAVNARWFDAKSKAIGDEYRDGVFAAQPTLYNNPDLLRQFTETFAQSHHIALPFAIDPQGTLAAEVKADQGLGQRIGIEHTPTIWIVTANSKGAPFIEVIHPEQELYQIIDQAIADTSSGSAGTSAASVPEPPPSPPASAAADQQATVPPATSSSAPSESTPQTQPAQAASDPAMNPPAPQSNWKLWLLGSVALLLAAGGLVFLRRSRVSRK